MMKFFLMSLFIFFVIFYVNLQMFYYNLCFIMSFMMIVLMSSSSGNFQMISFYFGYDYYSILMGVLVVWIVGLMFMSIDKGKEKYVMFIFIKIILIMGFCAMNLFMFYLFFEISLVPMFMIIMLWGVNKERLVSAYYMLMYTLLISMPLVFYILDLYSNYDSLDFNILIEFCSINIGMIEFIIYLMAFLIKMPIYGFHVWLPKAHVEAPVYGSMILAGILLKLGGYGLMRIMVVFLSVSVKYNYLIFSVSMVGGVLVSLITLVQIDMKMLVAYSSVVHMNFVICSMMTLYKLGFVGAYLMMIAHGLCSSSMFYLVTCFYKRSGSRLLIMNKGMISFMPSMMIMWLYLCVSNFSFPLSMNFFGEIMMIMSVMMWELKVFFMIMIISLISSAYSLYLVSYVMHGNLGVFNGFASGNVLEYMIIFIHCYPMILILLNLLI